MDIGILGAGIGGLTTALALQRRGKRAEVFESAPKIRAVGAGLWIPPNAMKVFDQLKVGDQIRSQGVELKQIEVRDYRNRLITHITGKLLQQKYGSHSISIERSALHRILSNELSHEQIHLGMTAETVDVSESKVQLTFSSGAIKELNLLIASDGIHSIIRKSLFPPRSLRYSGQRCFRGLLSAGHFPFLKGGSVELWGRGVRFGCSPVGPDKFYWYATKTQAPGVNLSNKEALEVLKSDLQDFPSDIQDFVHKIDPAHILQNDLYDLTPDAGWIHSRVALLGDAAHATTPNLGQGAALAVEDAWAISEELERTESVAKAFHSYNERRKQRTQFIVDTSLQIAKMTNWENPAIMAIRNFLLRHTPNFVVQRHLNKIYQQE
ncbi:MAG: FAD-dependent monooxygenase [Pseudobdellovibrionaceae bacterium]